MNVLTLGVAGDRARAGVRVRAWRSSGATFSGEPRHQRRLAKVLAIEARGAARPRGGARTDSDLHRHEAHHRGARQDQEIP